MMIEVDLVAWIATGLLVACSVIILVWVVLDIVTDEVAIRMKATAVERLDCQCDQCEGDWDWMAYVHGEVWKVKHGEKYVRLQCDRGSVQIRGGDEFLATISDRILLGAKPDEWGSIDAG